MDYIQSWATNCAPELGCELHPQLEREQGREQCSELGHKLF